jgi:hypothetical protein
LLNNIEPKVQIETKVLKDEAPSYLPAGKKWKLVWHTRIKTYKKNK